MNDRLWGTLNASIILHPKHEADSTVSAALERSIVRAPLRHRRYQPLARAGLRLRDARLGRPPERHAPEHPERPGRVHNTVMVEGIEKSVVRGPLVVKPKPAWFYDNKKTHEIGPKLVDFEAAPSWLKVPSLALTALGRLKPTTRSDSGVVAASRCSRTAVRSASGSRSALLSDRSLRFSYRKLRPRPACRSKFTPLWPPPTGRAKSASMSRSRLTLPWVKWATS